MFSALDRAQCNGEVKQLGFLPSKTGFQFKCRIEGMGREYNQGSRIQEEAQRIGISKQCEEIRFGKEETSKPSLYMRRKARLGGS